MDGAALLASGGAKAESSKIRDSRGSVFRVARVVYDLTEIDIRQAGE